MRQALLTPNRYSRPGTPMDGPLGIVMHWVANPGTSAEFNRRWFESRKDGANGFGSAHYIIDDNETVQCIPDDEIAYHAGPSSATSEDIRALFGGRHPNQCAIGIELCHPDWSGRFTDKVVASATKLCAVLCVEYGIPVGAIIRHYDCTGKDCPRWWVDNVHEWHGFLSGVRYLVREAVSG